MEVESSKSSVTKKLLINNFNRHVLGGIQLIDNNRFGYDIKQKHFKIFNL